MAQTSSRPPGRKKSARSDGNSSKKTIRKNQANKKPPAKPRKTGKKGKSKNSLLLLLACFILGISLGGGLLWYFQPSAAPKPNPGASHNARPATQPAATAGKQLYEEPINREIMRVDNAIYTALAKADVEQARIKLWVDLAATGEISRLEVNLNGQQKLESVANALNTALKSTNVSGKWQKQDNFWHLDVYVENQLTHQVNLRKQAPAPETSTRKPRVVIVVDDVGMNPEALNQLLGLQMELTFSVLPYAPNAAQIARKITGQGRELWLHLPMEPLGRHNPGPGALYTAMSQQELTTLTEQALDRVPDAVGVNNHMGSSFTQNAGALNGPLTVIKQRNLMFIDSVTSPKSVAAARAREMGLTVGQRDIFLDHEVKEADIVQQIAKLIRLAKSKGSAIAICHPHPATIAALKQTKPLLMQMVELVPASILLENP